MDRTLVDAETTPSAPLELSIRQLALPLAPSAALAPPSHPPPPVPTCPPERVWTELSPAARAQVERVVRRVFQEVLRDADRG